MEESIKKDVKLENIKEDKTIISDKDTDIEKEKEKEKQKEKKVNRLLEFGKLAVGLVKTVFDYNLKKSEIEINNQNIKKKRITK